MELSRGGSLGGLSFDLSLTPDDPLEPEPETLKRHSGRCKINLFSDEKKTSWFVSTVCAKIWRIDDCECLEHPFLCRDAKLWQLIFKKCLVQLSETFIFLTEDIFPNKWCLKNDAEMCDIQDVGIFCKMRPQFPNLQRCKDLHQELVFEACFVYPQICHF